MSSNSSTSSMLPFPSNQPQKSALESKKAPKNKCRICHQSEQPLIRPCHCKGSVGYVHSACIIRWMTSQKTIECSVCNHLIAASMIYHSGTVPLEKASVGSLAGMASKYLFFKGLTWGGRVTFFIIIWLLLYPMLSALCLTACLGYPQLFISAIKVRLTPIFLSEDDDFVDDGITMTVASFWVFGLLLQLILVPVVLGALMWVRFCTDNQEAIPALQVVVAEPPPPPHNEDIEPATDVGDNIDDDDEGPIRIDDEEELNAEQQEEKGQQEEDQHTDEGVYDDHRGDGTYSSRDELSSNDADDEDGVRQALRDFERERSTAAISHQPFLNPGPEITPISQKSENARLVEIKDKGAIIAALRNANGEHHEDNIAEDEFFASVLGFTGDYIFSIGIFIAMVVLLLVLLAIFAMPVFFTGRFGSYAISFLPYISRLVDNSSFNMEQYLGHIISGEGVGEYYELAGVLVQEISGVFSFCLNRCILLASVISNNMFGFELTTIFSNTHISHSKAATSTMASVLMWMFGINVVAKFIMFVSPRVSPPAFQPLVLCTVTFVNGVLGKVMHLFVATFSASIIAVMVLSDTFVGSTQEGALIVTPEHAFEIVGGPVKIAMCGDRGSENDAPAESISFTRTIAALRILQTNPLPPNTCRNYFDFSNCTKNQMNVNEEGYEYSTVQRYLSYCGAFEEEEEITTNKNTISSADILLADLSEYISITTVWSSAVHPDPSQHPLRGLLDPFTLAVLSRDISVGRHVFSSLLVGYTSTTFTFATITFLQECIHISFFKWLFPVPPHGSQAEFLLANPSRNQLFPLFKTLSIIVLVQCLFVRTAAHILMEAFWAADLFPLVMSDSQLVGIGATMFLATFVADPVLRTFQRCFEKLIKLFDLQSYLVLGEWPEGDFAVELFSRVALLTGTVALMTLSLLTALGGCLATLHLVMSVAFSASSFETFKEQLIILASSILSKVFYLVGLGNSQSLQTPTPTQYTQSTLTDYLRFSLAQQGNESFDAHGSWPPEVFQGKDQPHHASGVTASFISLRATHASSPFMWGALLVMWVLSNMPLYTAALVLLRDFNTRVIEVWRERLNVAGAIKLLRHLKLRIRLARCNVVVTLRVLHVSRATEDIKSLVEKIQFQANTTEDLKEIVNSRFASQKETETTKDVVLDEELYSSIEVAFPISVLSGVLALLAVFVECVAFVTLIFFNTPAPHTQRTFWMLLHLVHLLSLPQVQRNLRNAFTETSAGGTFFNKVAILLHSSARRKLLLLKGIPIHVSLVGGPLLIASLVIGSSFKPNSLSFLALCVHLFGLELTRDSAGKTEESRPIRQAGKIWSVVNRFATHYFNDKHCQGIMIHDTPDNTGN